jgi:hypothetical protein
MNETEIEIIPYGQVELDNSDNIVIDLSKILQLAAENGISLATGKLVLDFWDDYYDGTHLERVLLKDEGK